LRWTPRLPAMYANSIPSTERGLPASPVRAQSVVHSYPVHVTVTRDDG
jgi:hypothetical protein